MKSEWMDQRFLVVPQCFQPGCPYAGSRHIQRRYRWEWSWPPSAQRET